GSCAPGGGGRALLELAFAGIPAPPCQEPRYQLMRLGAGHVSLEDALHREPRLGSAQERIARPGEAVEGRPAAPGGGGQRSERGEGGVRVRAQVGRSPVNESDDRLGRERRAQECRMDSLTGERIDETCSVPDQNAAALAERISGNSKRKSVAAHVLQGFRIEVERPCEPVQLPAQMRAFALPADDADVEVIELGEDPRVATRNRPSPPCKPPPKRGATDEHEWHVRFERDEVQTRTADAELSGDHSVHPVGAYKGSGARRPGLRS